MSNTETVTIVCPENKRTGYKIINKEDLKPTDKLYDVKTPKAEPKVAEESTDSKSAKASAKK